MASYISSFARSLPQLSSISPYLGPKYRLGFLALYILGDLLFQAIVRSPRTQLNVTYTNGDRACLGQYSLESSSFIFLPTPLKRVQANCSLLNKIPKELTNLINLFCYGTTEEYRQTCFEAPFSYHPITTPTDTNVHEYKPTLQIFDQSGLSIDISVPGRNVRDMIPLQDNLICLPTGGPFPMYPKFLFAKASGELLPHLTLTIPGFFSFRGIVRTKGGKGLLVVTFSGKIFLCEIAQGRSRIREIYQAYSCCTQIIRHRDLYLAPSEDGSIYCFSQPETSLRVERVDFQSDYILMLTLGPFIIFVSSPENNKKQRLFWINADKGDPRKLKDWQSSIIRGKTIKGKTVEFKAKVNSIYWSKEYSVLVIKSKQEVGILKLPLSVSYPPRKSVAPFIPPPPPPYLRIMLQTALCRALLLGGLIFSPELVRMAWRCILACFSSLRAKA